MTAKEKAKQIFDKYDFIYVPNYLSMFEVKQCALILVDEIIDSIDWHEFETPNKELNYWLDVRKEINNLL
jgi:hypothetical protein